MSWATDIPEKTCPECGKYVARRKNERCPGCGTRIHPYRMGRGQNKKTIWVLESHNTKEIIEAVRDYVRLRQGLKDFEFEDMKKQFGAAKLLLDKCGGSQSVALSVVEAFTDPDLRRRMSIWPRVRSVTDIISNHHSCFSIALHWAIQRSDLAMPQASVQLETF